MRNRASHLDQQSEVRTKIQDTDADRLDVLAKRWHVTGYEATRRLLLRALREAEQTGHYLDSAGRTCAAPPVIPSTGIPRRRLTGTQDGPPPGGDVLGNAPQA